MQAQELLRRVVAKHQAPIAIADIVSADRVFRGEFYTIGVSGVREMARVLEQDGAVVIEEIDGTEVIKAAA